MANPHKNEHLLGIIGRLTGLMNDVKGLSPRGYDQEQSKQDLIISLEHCVKFINEYKKLEE